MIPFNNPDEHDPVIELDFWRDLCPRHLEPFRRHWPQGAMMFLVLVWSAFVRLPEVQSFATSPGEKLADARLLPDAMIEFGPLCCAIDHQLLREITRFARDGRDKHMTPGIKAIWPVQEE